MEDKSPRYFDHHATTPVDPRVLEAMLPFFCERFGNATSSQHSFGWDAKGAIDRAREQVASLLAAEASEVVFTSGATESIHLALLGFLEDQGKPCHLITSNAEHKCVLEVCARAQKLGHDITFLPVDRWGQVTAEQVEDALKENTALVSLVHGNNEIGSLNPISKIGEILAPRGIVLHVDAAQTGGKHPIDVTAMGIGLLSLSAHKFYGPKGVGALYMRQRPKVRVAPYLVGGGQERGLRGGTHNVPGIVGLGAASALAEQLMPTENPRLAAQRDHLVQKVMTELEGVDLNGHPTERLCNNVSLTVHGVQSDQILLGLRNIAYSSTSACSSGGISHVLKAIGRDPSDPFSTTLRLGLGRSTTDDDIAYLCEKLIATVKNAREKTKA